MSPVRFYSSSSSIFFKYISKIINHCAHVELPAHEIILMPALSPTMTVGNIGTWHKKVGDPVQPGDLLCEIETDKAQMDFEVQEEGFLAKILMPAGMKEAEVGKVRNQDMYVRIYVCMYVTYL
jgi:pyruvate dehydrogenase E2 component (dihydrolipoamide acetyltransferase)